MEKTALLGQEVSKIWELYEEMKEIVYVSDVDTHELVYMNRRARELHEIEKPDEIKGKKCYEVLAHSSAPCAVCNCNKLKKGFFVEEVRYLPILKKKMALKDTLIEENGKRYLFELAVDLEAWEQNNRGYEDNEVMVNEGLRLSMSAPTPEKSIEVLLEYLGQSLCSERVYIFEESGNNTCDNTYEWCASGVVSQKDNLQGVSYEVLDMWYQRFRKGENVIIKNVEQIRETDAALYKFLEIQSIKSMVASPLVNEGKIVGFYGVDNPPERFLEHITTLLQILGHFIVALLHRRDHVRRLEELCFEDQLTGMGNRHAVQDYTSQVKEEESVGLVYCDVMGLKKENDTNGHLAGDKLLIRASECLRRVFGAYKLFRVGGDEFLAVCMGIEEKDFSDRVERLKAEMRKQKAPMGIGCVWRADSSEGMDKLLALADNLMYEDKRMLYATEYKDMARD